MEMERNGRTYGVSIFNELLAVTIVYTGGEAEVAISFRFSQAGRHVISQVLEKLKFRKLRIQKPEPPILLYSGGQSTNRGAPHVALAAGEPRSTRRRSSFHACVLINPLALSSSF